MHEKDITEKTLEAFADVFSDIVNVLLFNGEERIDPAALVDALPRSVYKADGKIHEQERDTAKYIDVGGMHIALVGLENQSAAQKEVPIRCLSYDGASYRNIPNQRRDAARNHMPLPNLYPVLTLVLYFGYERWSYPKNLIDILEIPEGFEPYISDYSMNLFEISYLSDETVSKFRSDFRYVAQVFTQGRLIHEGQLDHFTLAPGEIVHSVEVLELLSVMTGDDRFERAYNESLQGGSVSMFTVLDFYENKGREEGLKEGLEKGLEQGREQGLEQGLEQGRKQGHRDTISATLTDFVRVLKGFVSDFDQIYEKVQESESYKGISRDVVLDIFNKV